MSREEWIEKIKYTANESIYSKEYFEKEEYENNKEMIRRRSLYLSPESIALDIYTLAGLCFRISDKCKDNISWYITTRAKSPMSSLKKQKRFDEQVEKGMRESPKIYDIIACNFIVEHIAEDKDGLKNFSSKVRAKYDERETNIDLLAAIIRFFNEQAKIGNFYSEYDRKETVEEKIKVLQKSFNIDFGSCIQKYRKDIDFCNKDFGRGFDENQKEQRPDLEEYLIKILQDLKTESKDENLSKIYTSIRKWLIAEQTMSTAETDDQEEYFKYLTVLLYRLKNLEYKECEDSYNEIQNALNGTLATFSKYIDEGFNDNITLEYIENLEKWCKKLKSQLSDRLQNQVMEELIINTMNLEFFDSNLSVAMSENPEHSVDIERNIKSNGYVALHSKIVQRIEDWLELKIECKGMSSYRDKVAKYGSASYGEKRLGKIVSKEEARKEKQRPIHLIPHVEEIRRYKNQRNPDDKDNIKLAIVIEGLGRLEDLTEEQLNRWRRNIDKVTPKYFNTVYDKKTDSIIITFHSMLKNAKIYFREINNRRKKHMIEEGLKIIEEYQLLDSKETEIVLTRTQYHEFMQNGGLDKLIESVKKKYYEYDKKRTEDSVSEFQQ